MPNRLPDEADLAPTRAAEDTPAKITPTDEDVPTPDLEGMADPTDVDDTQVDLDALDVPLTDDDLAATVAHLED